MAREKQKLQIIPLGGLGEIGKNMTVVRYGDEILLIDAGLIFLIFPIWWKIGTRFGLLC